MFVLYVLHVYICIACICMYCWNCVYDVYLYVSACIVFIEYIVCMCMYCLYMSVHLEIFLQIHTNTYTYIQTYNTNKIQICCKCMYVYVFLGKYIHHTDNSFHIHTNTNMQGSWWSSYTMHAVVSFPRCARLQSEAKSLEKSSEIQNLSFCLRCGIVFSLCRWDSSSLLHLRPPHNWRLVVRHERTRRWLSWIAVSISSHIAKARAPPSRLLQLCAALASAIRNLEARGAGQVFLEVAKCCPTQKILLMRKT